MSTCGNMKINIGNYMDSSFIGTCIIQVHSLNGHGVWVESVVPGLHSPIHTPKSFDESILVVEIFFDLLPHVENWTISTETKLYTLKRFCHYKEQLYWWVHIVLIKTKDSWPSIHKTMTNTQNLNPKFNSIHKLLFYLDLSSINIFF